MDNLKSAMLALCSAFNREADRPFLMAYEMGLEGLTSQQIERAVRESILTSRFMPTVAELRELAGPAEVATEPFVPEFLRDEPKLDWSCSGVLSQLRECAATGGALHDLAARLMPGDPEHEPRYGCLDCSDRGVVTCWHPATMEAARRGRLRREHPHGAAYRVAVPCHCRAGNRFENWQRGGWDSQRKAYRYETVVVYDPAAWIKCGSVADLIDAMESWKPANFEVALDAWNERVDL